jgi:hypothetical protein
VGDAPAVEVAPQGEMSRDEATALFQEKHLIRAKFDLNQQVLFCVITTLKFKRGGYITAVEASQILDGVDQQSEKEVSGLSAGSLVEWFNTRISSVATEHSKQEVGEGTGKRAS